MTDRTTVRLPEDLLNRARRKAVAEGRTLTSLIEDGLRAIVGENRKTERARHASSEQSRRRGLMPGFDLTEQSTLQEADDLRVLRPADAALRMILPDVNVLIYAFRERSASASGLPAVARRNRVG